MLVKSLISKVLVQTFEEKVGKWQAKKPVAEQQAIKFTFSLRINHDKEDGYRQLELLVYAPMNYVGVYTRETWTVIPLEDLEDGDDAGLKPGKDYTTGASEWKEHSYHDSCWRTDGIDSVLQEYAKKISSFSGSSFYEVVSVPPEIESLR